MRTTTDSNVLTKRKKSGGKKQTCPSGVMPPLCRQMDGEQTDVQSLVLPNAFIPPGHSYTEEREDKKLNVRIPENRETGNLPLYLEVVDGLESCRVAILRVDAQC